jgi:uncharacterized repeat protein (TIGR01451 family)
MKSNFVFSTAIIMVALNLFSQLPFAESFTGSTAPGVIFGGNPNAAQLTSGGPDPVGQGFLRITNNSTNQTGFAYNNDVVLPGVGLSVEFEYFIYGGNNGDGLTFFLFDAEADPFQIGGFGGSLGYAQRTPDIPGVSLGYLGIGLDVFGNFSNPTEGRQGGPSRQQNSVTLRGKGNGFAQVPTNYPYLTHTRTSNAPFNFNIGGGATRVTDSTQAGYRKCYIRLKPRTGGGYFIDVDIRTGGTPTTLHHVIVDFEYVEPAPQELKFGWAAGTGGATNFHEIRSFKVDPYDLSAVPQPVATNDFSGACVNDPVVIDFISNDFAQGPSQNFLVPGSIDLDPITAGQQTTFAIAGEGTFEFNTTTNELLFSPVTGFTGTTTVDYTINDAYGQTSNVATISVNVVSGTGCLDLAVNKTLNISNPENNDVLTFSITASNHGPNDATGVIVTDVIPVGYTYISNNVGASYDAMTQTLSWNIGDLDSGDADTMQIQVSFISPAVDHLNVATISGNEDDSNPNNDSSAVNPLNLSISKTANTMSPSIGGQITFTLEVENQSSVVDAPIVQVIDTLPSGFTHLSNNGGISVEVLGNIIIWNVGYLPANTSQSIQIVCVVESSGSYENTAFVRDLSGKVIDTNPADNESSVEPSPNVPNPFTCNNTGYLLSGTPNTQISEINFATGATSAPVSLNGITGLINAVGYNVIDNFIWGYHQGNNTIVRIDSDLNVDEFTVAGLPNLNYVAGDVSPSGILHLYDPSQTFIVRVNVNPNNSNYLQTLSNLTILNNVTPVALNNLQDFAFNAIDGNLYGIFNGSNSRRVIFINPHTGARVDRGTLQAPTGTTPNGPYEAVFTDSEGRTLMLNGGNGSLWGVSNVTLPGQLGLHGQNLFTSSTIGTGLGDGAFCRNAAFGQNWFDILAQDDNAGIHPDTGADSVVNVLPNDSKGSYTTTAPGVNLSVISNTDNVFNLDLSSGWVGINDVTGIPPGIYTMTYEICEIGIPSNCDQAEVTVEITASSPLPVTWLSFVGENIDGANHLKLITASELNNDYFEVQRTIDGLDYEVLGFVQGNGTTSLQSQYSFIDRSPNFGFNYYRIRQVDYNGEYDFSNVIAIDNSGSSIEAVLVFPNPTKGILTLVKQDEIIGDISITDATGKVVMTSNVNTKLYTLDVSHLPAGIYFIADDFGWVSRLVKQ